MSKQNIITSVCLTQNTGNYYVRNIINEAQNTQKKRKVFVCSQYHHQEEKHTYNILLHFRYDTVWGQQAKQKASQTLLHRYQNGPKVYIYTSLLYISRRVETYSKYYEMSIADIFSV